MNGEFCYFSGAQGSGYIEDSPDALAVNKVPFCVVKHKIEPGQLTDLVGFFCRPLKYLGIFGEVKRIGSQLIFYMGSDEGLFQRHYFQAVFLISRTRIYEHFSPKKGRDFNFVGGVWK